MRTAAPPATHTTITIGQPRLLQFLRLLALTLPLWAYTYVGIARDLPPLQGVFQNGALLLFAAWAGWKLVRRQPLARSPLAGPIVALLLAMTLATTMSTDVRVSLNGLLQGLTVALVFFITCDLLLAGWAPRLVVGALLALATLMLVQGLAVTATWFADWYGRSVPEYPPFLIPFRIFGVADYPTQLAALINLALPWAIVGLWKGRGAARVGWAAWLCAHGVVLFYTRSRGGLLAAGTCIAIIALAAWLERLRAGRGPRSLRDYWRASGPIAATIGAYAGLLALLWLVNSRISPSEYNTNSGGGITGDRQSYWAVAFDAFRSHPLVGIGPLTFSRYFYDTQQATRWWVPPHAHNLWIDTLAQQGLLGLAAIVAVVAAGAWALTRCLLRRGEAAHGATSTDTLGVLCVCAALAGWLAQMQVDIMWWLPTNGLLVAMLCALGMQHAGALRRAEGALPRWRYALALVPLALGAVLLRQQAATGDLEQAGDAAGQGDWRVAAAALNSAAANDPALTFYDAARGYADGVLAAPVGGAGDGAALERALASTEAALAREPAYVPTLLNSAALHGQHGELARARQELDAAVQRGADWALPALLLANQEEAAGHAAHAEALFLLAFEREPRARAMAGCLRSVACRALAQQHPPTDPIGPRDDAARALLAHGQPQAALDALRAIPVTSTDARPWISRAEAHLALGQVPQALFALNVARAIGGGYVPTATRMALAVATLREAVHQPGQALATLEDAARTQPAYLANHSYLVFWRIDIAGPLLPRLDLLQRTPDDLALLRRLAALYAQQGRASDAARARALANALAALFAQGQGTNS